MGEENKERKQRKTYSLIKTIFLKKQSGIRKKKESLLVQTACYSEPSCWSCTNMCCNFIYNASHRYTIFHCKDEEISSTRQEF